MSNGPHKEISNRVASTLPPIMQVMKDMVNEREILNLSQGIPYFDPPEDSIRSAVKDVDDLHRYGPDGGDQELKEELARKLYRQNKIQVDPNNGLMVTSGANLGFFNAAAAICDHGDEMVLLDPFYFNHKMTMDILGIQGKHVSTDENYLPEPERIEEAIGPKTKAVVVVSPNNPTGMTYPRSILKEILKICIEKEIFLISDETYEGFEYDSEHIAPSSMRDNDNVISLYSFSKNYSLSGWRIGYMTYPSELHDGLLKVQDTTVICPSRMSQKVALHCLRDHPRYIDQFIPELQRSRQEIIAWIRRHSDIISCPEPNGAYYALPKLEIDKAPSDSMELVKDILDNVGVLLVPGTPFGRGSSSHFRIAYGNLTRDHLLEALSKLDEYFERF